MNSQMQGSRRTSAGFTLIELVVVITILGILAAIALPKFVNLQRDARISKLQAALGAVNAAAAITHGAALPRYGLTQPAPGCTVANGLANPPVLTAVGTGDICTEAGNVNMINGYPTGTFNGLVLAAGLQTAAGVPTAPTLLTEGWVVTAVAPLVTIQPSNAPAPGTCQFTYSEAAANGAPTVTAPVTTGC